MRPLKNLARFLRRVGMQVIDWKAISLEEFKCVSNVEVWKWSREGRTGERTQVFVGSKEDLARWAHR